MELGLKLQACLTLAVDGGEWSLYTLANLLR